MEEDLQSALEDARTYNRMGALDHGMILDIAHDHNVDPKAIYDGLEWDWPE